MATVIDEHTQWVGVGGKPLTDGLLYIGIAGSDPVANPKAIFSDSALSIPAANPQPLDSQGRTTLKLYLDGEYSLQANDVHGTQQYQSLEAGTSSEGLSIIGLTDVSGGDTIVASGDIFAYVDKSIYTFTVAQVNTGPVTLNIDSVGAKSVLKNNDQELIAGDFQAGQIVYVGYNGTSDTFQWVDQRAVFSGTEEDKSSASGDFLFLTDTSDSDLSIKASVADVLTNVAASITLIDAATILWDMAAGKDAKVTITADRTLDAPTNTEDGKTGLLIVEQDGTGGWEIAFDTEYKFPGGVALQPSNGASEKTIYRYYVEDSTNILLTRLWMEGSDSFGFFKEYDEGSQAANTLTTRAHGLGRNPSGVAVWLECTTTDAGWAVGQRLQFNNSGTGFDGTGADSYGIATAVDTTDVECAIGADGQTAINRTTREITILTLANWSLIIRVYE